VIRDGSMELVHEEEVIDILEPGEAFGHPSLLSGLAPAFTVRAHEDCGRFRVDPDDAAHARYASSRRADVERFSTPNPIRR
jgi:CBS domain-containing protein